MSELTLGRLKDLLRYNAETGEFSWISSRGSAKKDSVVTCVSTAGYVVIRIDGKLYLGHRLAWFYIYGKWPTKLVDHVDGARSNNRLSNLREVSESVNLQNRKNCTTANKCGFLGVSEDPRVGRYRARIVVNGKEKWLGLFDTPEKAHEAYLSAKRKLHEGCTI